MRWLINFVTLLSAAAIAALIPIAKAEEQRPIIAIKSERLSITMRIDDPIGAKMANLRLATCFAAERPLVHADPNPRLKI